MTSSSLLRVVAFNTSAILVLSSLSTCIPSKASVGKSGPLVSTGLKNLGNTCYMNAQLQCAFHVPGIRQLILDQGPSESEDPAAESIGLSSLRQVFKDMENAASLEGAPAVAPSGFCASLGIPVFEQQDSQEFWKLLLPALELPKLSDLYQGVFEDFITALDGTGRERRREEPFLDLSVDVSSKSIVSALANMFGKPELLSEAEGNGWRPEKGSPKVDALKGSLLRVQGLPSLLQIHLKRFHFDWQTETMSKVNTRFSFPRVLDLSRTCAEIEEKEGLLALYDLQSVVVHVGGYGSGHYYSYVRPDVREDCWYRFDDSIVTRVSYQEVVKDAYGGKSRGDEKKGISRLLPVFDGSFGWGGRKSSAYMLQYVKRNDITKLYER